MSDLKAAEKGWELTQKRVFTKWVNTHLRRRFGPALEPIENVDTQLEDGIHVMKLIHALYGAAIPKYNANPKMRPHLLDNCETALRFIDSAGVKTHFLKPGHLVDHDLKMILGMIWAIILDYQIKGISVEEMSAKEGLLLWCQKKTAGYRDVKVDNFHMSFQDGLAFCALIHRHRPDLLDFDALNKENKADNLKLAFDIAEEKLGLPRLLEVEDMLGVPRPDEKAVMVMVSEFFHFFANQSQQETAGRRIAKVVSLTKQNDLLKAEFLSKAEALVAWIQQTIASLQDHNFGNSVDGVNQKIGDFDDYKTQQKPPRVEEKLNVETIFNNLSMKLRANNRPAFEPAEGLSLMDIDGLWQTLEQAEIDRATALRNELARQIKLEALASRFFAKAQALQKYANGKRNLLASQENESFSTVGQVQVRLQMIEAFEADLQASRSRLQDAQKLGNELISDNYRDSPAVQAKIDELSALWDSVDSAATVRKSQLASELAKQQQQDQLRAQFAQQAKALERFLKDAAENARDHTTFGDTLDDVTAYKATLSASEADVLQQVQTLTASLHQVNDQLKALGVEENDYRVTPLTVGSIAARTDTLKALLADRVVAYDAELARQHLLESKRKEFAAAAQQFVDYLASKRTEISSIDGEPEDQIAAVNRIHNADEGSSRLAALSALEQENRELGVVFNKHTNLSYPVLSARWSAYTAFVRHTLEDLDQALALKNSTAAARAEAQQQQHLEDLKIQFANKANVLGVWLQSAFEVLNEPVAVSSVDAVVELQESASLVQSEYGAKAQEKDALVDFSATLVAAGIKENPLSELTIDEVVAQFAKVGDLLGSRAAQLDQELASQQKNEQLRLQFASSAASFSAHVDDSLGAVQASSEEGDVQQQLAALNAVKFDADALSALKALDQDLHNAGVSDNKHTNLTFLALSAKANSLLTAIQEKRTLLEKEILAQQHSQVPPEQLNEIKECFTQFDKDAKGHLIIYELKACLSALGESISEEGLDLVIKQYGDAEGRVDLANFTNFMVARLADADNENQILASFNVLSGGRDFVTEEQLRIAFPQDAEALAYLLQNIPRHAESGGYDFAAFVRNAYSR